jgi:nucleoside-diphosphate-sugar epimerase
MRAKGRSPTSAIAPPALIANSNFERSHMPSFHCRSEDVNRAKCDHSSGKRCQAPAGSGKLMAKQHILLTGASGLIGRHVARKLASHENLKLVCILRHGERHPYAESLVQQGAIVVSGNFYDPTAIKQLFEQHRFQQVIHLAAIRGGGKASAAEFQEVNVRGTEHLLREACERRAQKFIFCSSVGVHGTIPVVVPAGIKTPLQGDNQYHQSKIAAEQAVQSYILKGLNAYIVRPTITYGPGDDGFPQGLVNLVGKHLLWLPKKNHRVHLVDVERLAEVFFSLVVNDCPARRIFVAGDIEPVALRDLVDWIHCHLYRRPYPTYFCLPDWTFKLAFCLFQILRNEKWAARIALLSNDWHYQCADTYRLLGIQPVPTREAFGRFLREIAVAPR